MSRLPSDETKELRGVRCEEGPAELTEKDGRLCVRVFTADGYDCTDVDLVDLLVWVMTNRPDLLESAKKEMNHG